MRLTPPCLCFGPISLSLALGLWLFPLYAPISRPPRYLWPSICLSAFLSLSLSLSFLCRFPPTPWPSHCGQQSPDC